MAHHGCTPYRDVTRSLLDGNPEHWSTHWRPLGEATLGHVAADGTRVELHACDAPRARLDDGTLRLTWTGSQWRVEAAVGEERVRTHVDDPRPLLTASSDPLGALIDAIATSVSAPTGERFLRDMERERWAIHRGWQHVDDDARAPLTLLLITRLLFLHFVEACGWFGAHRYDYLRDLLLDPRASELYRERLRPLFFDALNRPPDERTSGPLFADLPFLNGGLFTEAPEEVLHPAATIPDGLVRGLMRRVFQRYRFQPTHGDITRGEIDPAMLGTLFERWMDPDSRQRTGTHYTPPDLVVTLCRPVLRRLLTARLGSSIVDWLDGIDPTPPCPEEAADALRTLDALRVLDPAAGTGAFLIHVAEAIATIRARLAAITSPEGSGLPYADHLRVVIHSVVCGVDISRVAVHLCTLRLWLCYASALPHGCPTPLPNLHHRIRHGDSLTTVDTMRAMDGTTLGLEATTSYAEACGRYATASGAEKQKLGMVMAQLETELGEQIIVSRRTIYAARRSALRSGVDRQQRLFAEARTPMSAARRAELARVEWEVDHFEARVTRGRKEGWSALFEPRIHFAPVMEAGGFDLVLGNPPWVRLSHVSADQRTYLARTYAWMREPSDRGFGPQADLSVAFFERAAQLTRRDGFVAMLLPSKVLSADYGRGMRRSLLRDHAPVEIVDLRDVDVGFRAAVYPTLLMVAMAPADGAVTISKGHGGRPYRISTQSLPASEDPRDVWPLVDPALAGVLRALLALPRLEEQYRPRLGVKTGSNRVFVRSAAARPGWVPCVRGADVRPMQARSGASILLTHDPETGEPVEALSDEQREWIEAHRERLMRRADARPGRPLWELFRIRRGGFGHRVVWRDISRVLEATPLVPVADGGAVHLNTCYAVHVPNRAAALRLALWLNLEPARFVARALAEPARGGFRRYLAGNVGRIPVPSAVVTDEGTDSQELLAFAKQLAGGRAASTVWTAANALAARLVGVSPEECARMRSHLAEGIR